LKVSLRHFAIVTAALCSGAAAMAADLPSTKEPAAPPPIPDWIVTLSVQTSVAPQYPGAERYMFYGSPGISIRKYGQPERFSTPDDGFGFALYDTDWLRIGPVGRYIGDRPLYHRPELVGLPYMEPSIEIGGFAEFTPLSWARARIELRQAITGHDGLVATASADVWKRWGNLTLSVGPRLNFGNDKFASSYFSVTPQQSAISLANGGALTPYNAQGGLTSAGLLAAARYDISETWRVTGFGGYQRLTGSVAGSPIVQHDGSRDQYIVGLEFAYSFRTAGWFNF
jgi:outer membrane scaffolding protein for murein synthesis (MipA/OmpV family)